MIGLVNGNAKWLPFADNTFHCGVTSPPYWSQRDYGVAGQLGLEPTPEEYIANMVAVFREVRRVLRDDGVLWLNIGDSYANNPSTTEIPRAEQGNGSGVFRIPDEKHIAARRQKPNRLTEMKQSGLKHLDLVGIPWRLAMALQADGWYLRSDVIWSKPNPMPESVNGWRWERHKVKSGNNGRGGEAWRDNASPNNPQQKHDGKDFANDAEWRDCPGCPTCAPNDGLVLRRGAWRPTKAHEYVFLLTKSDRYFCDAEAVREVAISGELQAGFRGIGSQYTNNQSFNNDIDISAHTAGIKREITTNRNRRTVWQIATQPYSGAHFATFPEALVEPCVKAATSERGCCSVCGAQWARVVESNFIVDGTYRYKTNKRDSNNPQADSGLPRGTVDNTTLGFRRTCEHDAPPVPCTVFDPFAGTGTVGVVAQKLGHSFIGLELSMEYIELAKERIAKSNGYHVGRLL